MNHVFACIWYYLGAAPGECSAADVAARNRTWMQVHGLHPHRGNCSYITCLYWSVMTLRPWPRRYFAEHDRGEDLTIVVITHNAAVLLRPSTLLPATQLCRHRIWEYLYNVVWPWPATPILAARASERLRL